MPDRPLLLGHRGARKYAPENTMGAFHLALEHGCDGFEFDVRITADRRCVICHDPKYNRSEVARASFADLPPLCDLETVLVSFRDRAFLNLEIKVAGAEASVLAVLKEYPPREGVIVSSFLPQVIRRLHDLKTEYPLGLICENQKQLKEWKQLPIQALMLHRGLVKNAFVEQVRVSTRIFVWTVNSAREMKKFAQMGVDGIISDDTKLLVETVGFEHS